MGNSQEIKPFSTRTLSRGGILRAVKMEPISIDSCINGGTQDGQNTIRGGSAPFQFALATAPLAAKSQPQFVVYQIAIHRVSRSQLGKFLEDQVNHATGLGIGFLDDVTGTTHGLLY